MTVGQVARAVVRSRPLLALAGVLLGLVVAEGVCRLREALSCVDVAPLFWQRDRFTGWGHEPGATGWAQRCLGGKLEWRAHTRINSRGLRDREIPYARGGGRRILVVGDSFTEGCEVGQHLGFPKQLERVLNQDAAPDDAVEVINAGVGAWGTDNQLLFYLREGWKYRPDLVLLAFFTGNDVIENHHELIATRLAGYRPKPYFTLDGGRLRLHDYPLPEEPGVVRLARELQHGLRRHSAAARVLFQSSMVREALADAPGLTGTNAALGGCFRRLPEPWREAWRITRGLLLRFRREVEARGSRFAVVVINDRTEVADNYWNLVFYANRDLDRSAFDRDKPNRLITTFLARRGIAAIPLLDVFRARFGATGVPGFFPRDGHWDQLGQVVAADAIAAALPDLLRR